MDRYGSPRWRLRVLGLAVLAAVVAFGVSACGGGSQAGSNSASAASASLASSPASSSGSQTAGPLFATVPAPAVAALPRKPPTGVRVDVVTCNIPGCSVLLPGNTAAAFAALGWKFKVVAYNLANGPSAENAAFSQVIQDKPDYVIWIDGFPYSTIAHGMAALKAAHIGSIASGGATLDPTLLNCVNCAAEFRNTSTLAMKVAQARTKNPNVAMIYVPGLSGPTASLDGLRAQAKAGGGTVSTIEISGTNTQQQNVQTVISYLQSHPQTQYVETSIDAFFEGLPAALQQAGLASQVKLITNLMTIPSDREMISSGQIYAGIAEAGAMTSWTALDTIAYSTEHLKIPASLLDPPGWAEVVTKANVNSLPASLQPPGYEQAFLNAWHTS